jgi:hypothetical protein
VVVVRVDQGSVDVEDRGRAHRAFCFRWAPAANAR